ncbi:hypothetical protein Vretimale_9409 [Volvox reticuliferus]|uniref:Uncharacterized protein n=1 Tax=Volvox reticuliferus TaxID=1737510 RepID=A0A8J4GDJ2_9CHLO|nr:hypothetical protein Vretimale_9409 [Volvox reticuliferus]
MYLGPNTPYAASEGSGGAISVVPRAYIAKSTGIAAEFFKMVAVCSGGALRSLSKTKRFPGIPRWSSPNIFPGAFLKTEKFPQGPDRGEERCIAGTGEEGGRWCCGVCFTAVHTPS